MTLKGNIMHSLTFSCCTICCTMPIIYQASQKFSLPYSAIFTHKDALGSNVQEQFSSSDILVESHLPNQNQKGRCCIAVLNCIDYNYHHHHHYLSHYMSSKNIEMGFREKNMSKSFPFFNNNLPDNEIQTPALGHFLVACKYLSCIQKPICHCLFPSSTDK